jgi:fumarate hydratase, class II
LFEIAPIALQRVYGTELNRRRIDEMLGRSLMLVTALSPVIGYDKVSAIAHKASERA